jgi:hypothetical protein
VIRGTAHKKGGMNDLGKLRSEAKRNGVILILLICGGSGLMQYEIANIFRLLMIAQVRGGWGAGVFMRSALCKGMCINCG